MNVSKFDTFENEAEMAVLIQKLQDNSIEYLKLYDPCDAKVSNPILQD